MEQFGSVAIKRLWVFFFAFLFIILQSVFTIKGANFFLILPSVFLILTYKPKLLGYFACFALGLINDLFAMQLMGVSSIIFVGMKFIKETTVSRAKKSYTDLLIEYCVYALTIFVSTFLLMMLLGFVDFGIYFIVSIFLLIIGFFICDFLWLKIFAFINKR